MVEGSMAVSWQGCSMLGRPADATVKTSEAEAGTLPAGRSANSATRRSPGFSVKRIGSDDAQSSAPHETAKVFSTP